MARHSKPWENLMDTGPVRSTGRAKSIVLVRSHCSRQSHRPRHRRPHDRNQYCAASDLSTAWTVTVPPVVRAPSPTMRESSPPGCTPTCRRDPTSPPCSTPAWTCEMSRSPHGTPNHARPCDTTEDDTTSTDTPTTSSPPTLPPEPESDRAARVAACPTMPMRGRSASRTCPARVRLPNSPPAPHHIP